MRQSKEDIAREYFGELVSFFINKGFLGVIHDRSTLGELRIPVGIFSIDGTLETARKICNAPEISRYEPNIATVQRGQIANRAMGKTLDDYHAITYFNPETEGLTIVLVGKNLPRLQYALTGRKAEMYELDMMPSFSESDEGRQFLERLALSDTTVIRKGDAE